MHARGSKHLGVYCAIKRHVCSSYDVIRSVARGKPRRGMSLETVQVVVTDGADEFFNDCAIPMILPIAESWLLEEIRASVRMHTTNRAASLDPPVPRNDRLPRQ